MICYDLFKVCITLKLLNKFALIDANLFQMIREAFKQEKQVQIKSSMADLVTESDKKVEQLIISTVKDKFPTHR